ncbi:hypothetical protein [Halobaculum rubrum]|uniref:hypothetical protein n=1 Tax=Halobaculum rubrum TaxID=2872158 RepID=UPI001CA3EEB1|nr:hypothetical protein [Halobaculum rubrum]QZX99802.1 hypothetical protein K6T25_01445 [Halobaculum rubrum]QZX99839.1 hypothetical protein K6T25_01640 [Halobaculum rubrum]
MATVDSPNGYTEYKKYNLPKWATFVARLVLLAVAVGLVFSESIILIPNDLKLYVLSFGIGLVSFIFIHESLHYVTASALGYDPVYVWPTMVYVPEESLPVKHILPMLLAPQLLSLASLLLLLSGVNLTLELILGWGLFQNIIGSYSDVLSSIRRLTWPTGTRVIVSEDYSTHVAFPKGTT